MKAEVTPAVNRALHAAARWAAMGSADEAGARELLCALLEEEEGRAAAVLRQQGITWEAAWRALCGGEPPALPPAAGDVGEQPPSSTLLSLLDSARQLAIESFGERTVASEHLLIAILRTDAGLRSLMTEAGLDLARLEATLTPAPIQLDEPLTLLEPTEQIDSARILDANANRAREALRVLEDFARFVLDDEMLCGELKRLRHDLASALGELPPALLLEGRETLLDVGTRITTAAEEQRVSTQGVVLANAKRLQESLRTLEEYGKLHSPTMGRALESLRYRSYTVERALLLGATARHRLQDVRLYVLITGSQCTAEIEWTVKEAAAGGAQAFQLREKRLSDRELIERARQVRRWTREAGALFIMNDRPDIARLTEADGIHVGQEELTVRDVRRIVGPDCLIGVSTHDLVQLQRAVLEGANYVGVGPTFPSATKPFEAYPGLEFVGQAAAATTLPAFAIGGITPENVAQVVEAGLRRIAVSQCVCQADDPQRVAAQLRQALS